MADILKTWQMYASQSTLLLYFSIIFLKFENDNRRHHRKSDKCTHPHCHAFLAYSQSPAFGLKFCNSALLILTCYFTKWGILSFAQGKVILAVMKQLKQLQIKPRILKERKIWGSNRIRTHDLLYRCDALPTELWSLQGQYRHQSPLFSCDHTTHNRNTTRF